MCSISGSNSRASCIRCIAGGLWSGAREFRAPRLSSTSSVMRVGYLKSSPPCTTLYPTTSGEVPFNIAPMHVL